MARDSQRTDDGKRLGIKNFKKSAIDNLQSEMGDSPCLSCGVKDIFDARPEE